MPTDKEFSGFPDVNHNAAFGTFTSRHYQSILGQHIFSSEKVVIPGEVRALSISPQVRSFIF
jgi:hypothetical protein